MNIVILGSTGSIGTQTLELLKDHPEYKILALSAGENISLLEEQAREWKPKYLCVFQEEKAKLLRQRFQTDSPYSPVIFSGMEGLIKLSSLNEADMIVVSVVGMVGITYFNCFRGAFLRSYERGNERHKERRCFKAS